MRRTPGLPEHPQVLQQPQHPLFKAHRGELEKINGLAINPEEGAAEDRKNPLEPFVRQHADVHSQQVQQDQYAGAASVASIKEGGLAVAVVEELGEEEL